MSSNQPSGAVPENPAERKPQTTPKADVMRTFKTGLYVVLAVITTIFLLRNSQSVEVDFVFASVWLPLYVVLAGALMLGAILGVGAMGMRSRRKTRERKAAAK